MNPERQRRLWHQLLGAYLGALSCFTWALHGVAIDRESDAAGAQNVATLTPYWFGHALMWVVLSALAWVLLSKPDDADCPARRRGVIVILAVAAIARLIIVFTTTPQLSDDIWRYIHDGRTLASHTNPYAMPPDEWFATMYDDPILDRVNHPNLTTIYQPTSQLVFGLLWRAHPASIDPLTHVTFRLGFVLLDLAVVGMLLLYLSRIGRNVWWAVLYAWHPLPLAEVAAGGHQDVIGLALLVLCFLAVSNALGRKDRGGGTGGSGGGGASSIAAGVFFAAGCAVKPIVGPLALPLAWALRGGVRRVVFATAAALVTGMALYAPFVIWTGDVENVRQVVQTFTVHWRFNSPVHTHLADWLGYTVATSIVGVVFAGVFVTAIYQLHHARWDVWRVAGALMLAMLLLSSTVYPWYLLWVLVIVPVRFSITTWVWSMTIVASYYVWSRPVAYELPAWVLIVEYAPVAAALFWTAVRAWTGRKRRG